MSKIYFSSTNTVDALLRFVLISVIGVNGRLMTLDPMKLARMNQVSTDCAASTGSSEELIEHAIDNKDIGQLSPCFFKCYINHYGVISQENGKDVVNVPAVIIFVKFYIPDIGFLDLLNIASEVTKCSSKFENSNLPDNQPGCEKTKTLISCLEKKEALIKAFWLATQS